MASSPLRFAPDDTTKSRMLVADQLSAAEREQAQNGADSQFERGLRAGAAGMSAGAFDREALAGELSGDPNWQQKRAVAHQMGELAGEVGPRVSSLRDVRGVGDAADWAAGAFGQGLVSMAPVVATAFASRVPGASGLLAKALPYASAAVPAYMLEKGEAVHGQYEDPALAAATAQDRDRVATYKGLANAGLEAAVPAGLANSFLRKPATSLLGTIGRSALEEGATEAAQEYVGYRAEKALDPNRQLDPWRIADAAAMGALTGGGVSAVTSTPGHLANSAMERMQAQQDDAAAPPQDGGDPTQPPGPIDPNTPLLPAPETLGDRAEELYGSLRDKVAPKAQEAYGKASDYVSDVIDRMNEAVKTAETPQDFLRQVFRPAAEDMAAADALPDTEDAGVLSADDPAAAMQQRDMDRAARAAGFADELLNDPSTPTMIKDRIAAMGGDYSNPNNQAYVASTLAAVKGGQKVVDAVSSLVEFSKSFADKAKTVAKDAADKISKKNLQDINEADIAPLVSLMAQRLGPARAGDAPKLARQLVAAANRLSPDATIDEEADRRLRNFSKVVDDEVLDAVTAASGSDALRNAITKIRSIPSAASDVRQSGGQSFLESMLKQQLEPAVLSQLSEFVDTVGLQISSMPAARKNQILGALASAFGSKREAQTVVEYYGNIKRDAFRREAEAGKLHEDRVGDVTEMFLDQPGRASDATYEGAASTAEWGALSENDGPGVEVGFRSAAAKRPFRKFAGERLSNGSSRREAWRAINDARATADADYATQDYSEYLASQGIQPEEGLSMVRRDIESRIKEHESRKGEDRSAAINELRGELELLETTASDKGAKAALDQYEVTTRSARAENDLVASDDDIKAMQTAARARPETVVEFRKADGKKLKLSAESMIKTLGLARQKKGGVANPKQQTDRQMFADAVASVLARDDIAGLVSNLKEVVLDSESGQTVERTYNPDRLAALTQFEKLQAEKSGGVPARRAYIRAQLQELETQLDELGDPTAAGFDLDGHFSDLRDQWQGSSKEVVSKAAKRVEAMKKARDEASAAYGAATDNNAKRSAYQTMERARAAFDYARAGLQDYKQFQRDVESMFYEVEREATEAGKSGVPGSDADEGPIHRTEESVRSGQRKQTNAETDEQLRADPGKLERLDRRGAPRRDGGRASERDEELAARYGRDSAMRPKKGRPGKIDRAAIIREIARIRGKDVKVLFDTFRKIGGSGEFSMNRDKTERVIKVAVNAADPMGVAWHESLHDFFAMLGEDKVGRSIKRDLTQAASAPHVKRRLQELLKDHPKALEQIEQSAEERVAYMYQFWAAGELELGPTGTSIFERLRQFFRDLLHTVGKDERALDLLTALHEGAFADPSVVAEVLSDMPRDRINNRLERIAPALTDTLQKLTQVAPDRLRAYQNDSLNKLADMFSSETGELGFVQRRFRRDGEWTNQLAGILAGTKAVERRAALDNLQAMKAPSSKLERDLVDFFGQMHDYMKDAGVKTLDSETKKWVPLRRVKNYFPRVFDREAILKDRDGFKKLLMQHGQMTAAAAENTIKALVHGTGQLDLAESEHSLGFSPYAQAVQDRQLKFINPGNAAEFAKFQSKDLADITTQYVKQAVHRAEYARMFGNNGEKLAELVADSGITDKKELRDIEKTVQGLEGTLGYEMSAQTKELMSGVMTLQNLVILPVAIFSQMVDPIVMAARSGDVKDAGNAFMTAVKRLGGKDVDGEDLAEMLGIISQDTVLDAMGVAYGTTHMSKRMRNINRVFFKYNGMQGWNNSMRIAATAAGERYLLKNRDNKEALAELGLEPKDIKTVTSFTGAPNAQNKVVGRERLDVSDPKVKEAMFRFVDQAVLRPSASNRPVWMSDPKFLLLAHLKQFTFAMHNVVLKRANQQLDEGNPKPWMILALAMPTILAADMAKFALTGGPPPGWGFKDFLAHAVERSGLLGLGDFGAQAFKGVEQGRVPGEALLGPSAEHLFDLLRFLGGSPSVSSGDVLDRSVPGARFL